jgi:nucleoid-associated protein YgaU
LPKFTAPPDSFDPIVATPPRANPFADSNASAGQGGWVAIPNSATPPSLADEPKGRVADRRAALTIARGPAPDSGIGDLAEPVPHVVRSGENFWTISRLYYGSGRFYKALWKANSDHVPAPEKLRVNQTVRIPPPEALDRSLILPPRSVAESEAASPVRRGARPAPADAPRSSAAVRSSEVELALPVADPFTTRRADRSPGDLVSAQGTSDRPRLPIHKIRAQETLRSIARDTLGDSRRASEILELNRDVIDDPNHLTPGQIIDLPEDTRAGRQVR